MAGKGLNSPLWHDTGEFQAGSRAPERSPQQPSFFREEVRRDQHTLITAIRRIVAAIETEMPRDPSTFAATTIVRNRLAEIEAMTIAVSALCAEADNDRMASLVNSDGPLADYVRGLHAWAKAVVRALEELTVDLRTLAPNWGQLRSRLEEAETFYLTAMEPDVIAQLEQVREEQGLQQMGDGAPDPLPARLRAKLAELFLAASALQQGLEQRFG